MTIQPPALLRVSISLQTGAPGHPVETTIALRSAFGWAFRRGVCVTGAAACEGCPLRASCAYGRIFDPAPVAGPLHPSLTGRIPGFALRPAQTPNTGAGQRDFELVLLAPKAGDLRLLLAILPLAIESNRAFFDGRAGIRGDLLWQTLPAPTLGGSPPAVVPEVADATTLRLDCLTPLAIKQDNVELRRPDHLRSETIWRLAWRRLTQYCQLAGQPLPDPTPWREAALRLSCNGSGLRFERHSRVSRSQDRRHPIDGFVGPLTLTGAPRDIARLRALLAAVLPLQIGKDTVFGLGSVRLLD